MLSCFSPDQLFQTDIVVKTYVRESSDGQVLSNNVATGNILLLSCEGFSFDNCVEVSVNS